MFSQQMQECFRKRCRSKLAIVSENTLTDIRHRFRYPRLAIDVANLSTHESH